MAAGVGAFSVASHIPEEQFSEQFMEISAEADRVGTDDPELQLLEESDPIPRAPLLARSDWEGDLRDDVEEALLNAEEEDLIDEDAPRTNSSGSPASRRGRSTTTNPSPT